MKDLRKRIKDKLWFFVRDYFYNQRIFDSPVIRNINYRCDPSQKKALLCYLTASYYIDYDNFKIDRTQPFEILTIVKLLSRMDYTVDIIGCKDINAIDLVKNKKYDLIFGFGETFYRLTDIQPSAISILYMTENHPDFSYREEKKRLDYFYERHGKKLGISRSGKFYKPYHLEKKYSHVITMGEKSLLSGQYPDPYFIFPTGLINKSFVFSPKDQSVTCKHYMWLGSVGAVHKGLDLLLDVFGANKEMFLHICGLDKKEKKNLTIPSVSNIIDHGHIEIKSDYFLQLVNQCSFVVLPSCSEASSTSVTTGMLHGLIPVVTANAGFSMFGDNALYLEDFKIGYLGRRLTEISTMEPATLHNLSQKVYEFANNNFTLEHFESEFQNILTDIHSKEKVK